MNKNGIVIGIVVVAILGIGVYFLSSGDRSVPNSNSGVSQFAGSQNDPGLSNPGETSSTDPINNAVEESGQKLALDETAGIENDPEAEQVVNGQDEDNESETENTSDYENGTYSATGTYTAPPGQEEIEISITLENGIITDTEFTGLSQNATSQRYQGIFAENYEELVIGQPIDEVELDKVAGSSLTPGGFNEALQQVRSEAQV